MIRTLALLSFIAVPAAAQTCPPPSDTTDAMDALIAAANAAPDQRAGLAVSGQMWALWTAAPDATAQEMLDRGMWARETRDYLGAKTAFDALVEYCPDYAEGYNQRAFVHFLTRDYAAAVADLERALERAPRHVAALSGLALSLMGLGQDDRGQDVLREALDLNPWLSERRLLKVPQGEEI